MPNHLVVTDAVREKGGYDGSSSPIVTSSELLGGARELLIEHCGELYRLRVTSNRKLILTK